MEQTKSIKGYEKEYRITSDGLVYSLERTRENGKGLCKVEGKVKNQHVGNNGYTQTRLWKNGESKLCLVHRLVAEAFIENPLKLRCVNHKDGDKQNNTINNLEWVSYSENMKHAYKNGLYPIGSQRRNSKLNEIQVKEIKTNVWNISHAQIAKKYGVTRESVRDILNGKHWRWLVV